MYQIKTYNAIAQEGLATFSDQYVINGQTDQYDGYVIRSADLHQEEFPKSLTAIVRAGAGVNNIPLDRADEAGIAVFNTIGGNANAVKELVLLSLLLGARPVLQAIDYAESNTGADVSLRTEANKGAYRGLELKGKTIAVIGLGHVGGRVANASLNLGMIVKGYDPTITPDAAWHLSDKIEQAKSLEQALHGADYVTFHVPYNEQNHHLLNAKRIAQLKNGAVVLNYSRNGIVDDAALVTAVNNQKVKHYFTDFGNEFVANQEGVTIMPHIGGSTVEAEITSAKMAANEMQVFLETGNTIKSVNLPNINEPFSTQWRITLFHENITNMLGQITTILGQHHVNIDNLINKGRGNYAYTIIEANTMPSDEHEQIIQEFQAIPAIKRARILENHQVEG